MGRSALLSVMVFIDQNPMMQCGYCAHSSVRLYRESCK